MDGHYRFRLPANERVSPDLFFGVILVDFLKLAFRPPIISTQVDHSLNVASSQVLPPQEKVFWPKHKKNKRFVDRPTVFEILNHTIETHKECTLCGLGGTGKSQIALEYCY